MIKSNRLDWIDQYRGILFYFVILFHTFVSPICLRWLFDFFFLPGFFFLSGYLFRPKGLKQNMLSIVNSLLIPYFIFSLMLSFVLGVKIFGVGDYFHNFVCIFVYGHDQIWFIPCLIVVEISATIVLNAIKDVRILYSILFMSFLSSFLIVNGVPHHMEWNIDTASYAFFFFMIGHLIKDKVKFPSKVMAFLMFCFYVILTQIIGGYDYIGTNNIDMHMNILGNPFVYMIMGVGGSMTLFFICPYLKILFLFRKLGQYTLFSFPFHSIVYYSFIGFLNKRDLLPSSEGGGIFYKIHLLTFCHSCNNDINMSCS